MRRSDLANGRREGSMLASTTRIADSASDDLSIFMMRDARGDTAELLIGAQKEPHKYCRYA